MTARRQVSGAILAIAVLLPASVSAHPSPFSYLDLRLVEDGIDGTLIVHDIDVAHDFGIDRSELLLDRDFAERYREQLTQLMATRLTLLANDAATRIDWGVLEVLPERHSLGLTFRLAGARAGELRIRGQLFPYDPQHQTFINIYESGALRHQAILSGDRQETRYFAGSWQGVGAVVATFLSAGIEHIIIGPDHVLFLVGLLLLGGSVGRLAIIVSAFTVGHSITLSLAALGVLAAPGQLIEPLIALSIIFVGVDNLLVQREVLSARVPGAGVPGAPPMMARARDIRAWVAGVFGLIHGFGFASVLADFGLPSSALAWSLLSFNAGVEIGQLAIVLLVATALAAVRRRSSRLTQRLVLAGSLIIIVAGGYWFVERLIAPR